MEGVARNVTPTRGAASVDGSRGSAPAIASVSKATSATVCASGPTESKSVDSGTAPYRLIRPYVGLRPVNPHSEDGMRIEPPVSDPSAHGVIPAVTAAAEPPPEPPGKREGPHGFRDGP